MGSQNGPTRGRYDARPESRLNHSNTERRKHGVPFNPLCLRGSVFLISLYPSPLPHPKRRRDTTPIINKNNGERAVPEDLLRQGPDRYKKCH